MSIITVSREFGSGGRELGKRLADELGYAYYDREIVTVLAEKLSMDETYLERILEKKMVLPISLTYAQTFNLNNSNLLAQQHGIIRELASQEDCVIVGRGANAILRDRKPFTLFVYADMASKIARCRSRAPEQEHLTDKELERKIKLVDKGRESNFALFSPVAWHDMCNYQLCVNTSGTEIKTIVPIIAAYAQSWLERNHI